MIDYFESCVRINPDDHFFTFVSEDGREYTYSYWQARLISVSLARRLQSAGVRTGDMVSVDLPNSPEFVFVALACAYSGLSMLLLDNSLSEAEKLSRTLDVERSGVRIAAKIDAELTSQVLRCARNLPADEAEIVQDIFGSSRRERSIMGKGQDAIDDTSHFAERESHLFDRNSLAVIVFADEKRGKNKKLRPVPLTWANLLDASLIANESLGAGGVHFWQERLPFNSVSLSSGSGRISRSDPIAVWQCGLSLAGIDGLQTMIRSIVARAPFELFERKDAEQLLKAADAGSATHIAVDESLLQDMVTIEEWRADVIAQQALRGSAPISVPSRLSHYRCMMLTSVKVNPRLIERAYDLGARLFASYGSPQTSGVIAASRIAGDYHGGVVVMDGYEVRIVDPDEEGFGRLAVRGPGVFDGYINTSTALTVDQLFVTNDKAAFVDGRLYVRSRSENMFVSAGQNIYPSEIADVLRHVAGVSGVHVFGVPDSRYGMLPVAAIERSDPSLTPQAVERLTSQWFSSITVPISIFVFDHLPRNDFGKLDRCAIEAMFS